MKERPKRFLWSKLPLTTRHRSNSERQWSVGTCTQRPSAQSRRARAVVRVLSFLSLWEQGSLVFGHVGMPHINIERGIGMSLAET